MSRKVSNLAWLCYNVSMPKNIGRPFDTSVLDAALAQRRAKNEQERQAVLTRVLHLLDEVGSAYGIQQAYVFGSLTKPNRFRLNSDVDIGVEQINPEHFFEAMSKLSTYLGREVDLVELNKCHFADKIRREGVVWTRPG